MLGQAFPRPHGAAALEFGHPGGPAAAPVTRYVSLDFWRGVACLSVVLYHSVLVFLGTSEGTATGVTGGVLAFFGRLSIGVQLFFVISGYCIAAAADSSRRLGLPVRTCNFFRRFRRIYPPLWFAILWVVLVFVVVDIALMPDALSAQPWNQPRPWWFSPSQWIGNLTLTETWRHHVWGGPRAHIPGQAWTLCYEEQFYAVMGLLLFVPRFLFSGAIAVTLFTALSIAVARIAGLDIEGFFFDGNWLNFAAGILVYWVVTHQPVRRYASAGLLLIAAAVGSAVFQIPGGMTGYVFAVVLLMLFPFDRALSGSAVLSPITWCGQMCYSLYSVHQVLVKAVSVAAARMGVISPMATLLVTVPLCVITSLVAAQMFHRVIERRFLNVRVTATSQPLSIPARLPASVPEPDSDDA